ncbi:MAG TPA: hypothetical protein VMM36_09250 [Opitutaceae bacterium]|nr:hypothetical protein [Opitutaceae bacterium]
MGVAELQKKIGKLSARERRSVAKLVTFLERREKPARKRELARIDREMSAGRKYSQAQVDAILARNPPRSCRDERLRA